jgi:hypothetical protein
VRSGSQMPSKAVTGVDGDGRTDSLRIHCKRDGRRRQGGSRWTCILVYKSSLFSLLLAVSLAVVVCSVASRWSFYHSYYGEPSGLRINKGSCSWDFLSVVLVQNGRNCESDLRM